jgi:hypothetical protein
MVSRGSQKNGGRTKSPVGEDSRCKEIDMGRKIDLAKVMASLNTLCPKCGYSIPPDESVTFTEMKCPKMPSGVCTRSEGFPVISLPLYVLCKNSVAHLVDVHNGVSQG